MKCNGTARPNVLMFGDWGFLTDRSEAQAHRFNLWLDQHTSNRLVVIEIGAGNAVPTVRRQSNRLVQAGARLIRINPREPHGPAGTLSMRMGGLEALTAIRNEFLQL